MAGVRGVPPRSIASSGDGVAGISSCLHAVVVWIAFIISNGADIVALVVPHFSVQGVWGDSCLGRG